MGTLVAVYGANCKGYKFLSFSWSRGKLGRFLRRNSGMHIGCVRNFCVTSSPLASVPLPSRMETHFWYIIPDEVTSVSLLNQYSELLSASEKENIHSMRGEELKKRALLARALVRTTIARCRYYFYRQLYRLMSCSLLSALMIDQVNQLNPRSLKFRKNIHGKPELEWDINNKMHLPPLHFNLSHTNSMIACGITANVPIGIDVEEKQRNTKHNVLAFSRRYFSPFEVRILESISDPEVQKKEFIKLWTLKEAYVKALGSGFSATPFKSFTIQFKPTATKDLHYSESLISESSKIIVNASDDPNKFEDKWRFVLLELAGTHYAAICLEEDETGRDGEIVPSPMRLKVWKTVPFIKDVPMSGTGAVKVVGGFIES